MALSGYNYVAKSVEKDSGMNVEQLESLLEGGQETQGIEFKGSMPWSVKQFARALLAMANVEDGGVIIIGVTNEGARQGLFLDDLKTYDLDTMKDQMNAYADPHVEFTFIPGKDASDKTYGIIRVQPFREIPVICCKDDDEANTQDGKIYYRNTNRRPESAGVSNSYDMRTIVEVAALRMMRKFEERGVRTGTPSNKAFDEELKGL